MLTKVNVGRAKSDEGFEVALSQNDVLYSEPGVAVRIPAEHDPGPPYVLLVSNKVLKADEADLGDRDKSKILARVNEALAFLGVNHKAAS